MMPVYGAGIVNRVVLSQYRFSMMPKTVCLPYVCLNMKFCLGRFCKCYRLLHVAEAVSLSTLLPWAWALCLWREHLDLMLAHSWWPISCTWREKGGWQSPEWHLIKMYGLKIIICPKRKLGCVNYHLSA